MEGKTVQVGKKQRSFTYSFSLSSQRRRKGLHLKCQLQKLITVAVNNRQITLLYLAPTQHHSFLRNSPPLFICLKFTFSFGGVFFTDNTANCEGSIAMASPKIDF